MTRCFNLSVCAFVVLSLASYALSIRCWTCRSDYNPACADPFDNSTIPITDCNLVKGSSHSPRVNPSMCQKIRQKVNGEWLYFRDCASLGGFGNDGIQGVENICLTGTGKDNIYTEYCTCNSKDACNSSYFVIPKPVLLLFLVIVPWLM